MVEREGLVTLKGNPMTLVGSPVEPGEAIPDVELASNSLEPVKLAELVQGKVAIVASVPSLDTDVCDAEIRRFNQEAVALGDDVIVVTVSVDLPFAQARWCGNAGVDNVITLSDYQERAFGMGFGVLMKEVKLLARCVWVVDRQGKVQYAQLVDEVAEEPDYESVLQKAKDLL